MVDTNTNLVYKIDSMTGFDDVDVRDYGRSKA